jgi:SIR2-like domain
MSENVYYHGGERIVLDSDEAKLQLTHRLRQYMEVRNFSLLVGNGCSIPLGAPVIHDTAKIVPELDSAPYRLENATEHNRARELLDLLIPQAAVLGVEPLLTVLASIQATEAIVRQSIQVKNKTLEISDVRLLERLLKKWLFYRCAAISEVNEEFFRSHQELIRRILLRSTTLPRAKVFTTNYDLVLERALDALGVVYFDGFIGTITRTLRTESYHYDLYYPGETTEGRVSRVDRVLHLYKLHGSINWRRRDLPAGDVVISQTPPQQDNFGNVMIYPSPLKVTEMNGYPYSEMFRHFSAQLHQPQSVLLTIGYRFQDDHISRLIYQALSVPSFVLIVITPSITAPEPGEPPKQEHEIWRLTTLRSKRILVITGGEKDSSGSYTEGAGTLQGFSTTWLPDISELNVEAAAREDARRALAPLTTPSIDNDK